MTTEKPKTPRKAPAKPRAAKVKDKLAPMIAEAPTAEEAEVRRTRLKTLIALGKERGYLTYAEINDHLPDDLVDAEQIESIISTFNDMGIQVFDVAPAAEDLLMSEVAPTVVDDEQFERFGQRKDLVDHRRNILFLVVCRDNYQFAHRGSFWNFLHKGNIILQICAVRPVFLPGAVAGLPFYRLSVVLGPVQAVFPPARPFRCRGAGSRRPVKLPVCAVSWRGSPVCPCRSRATIRRFFAAIC